MTLKYSRSQHVCGRLYCVVQDEECTGRKRRRSRGVLFFNGKASVNFYPAPFSDKVPTFFGERLSVGSKWRTAGVRRGVGNKGEETDARKQRPEAEKGFVIAALLLYDQLA